VLGSGKSHYALDLIKHFYKGSYHFIIFISPTFQLQDIYLNIEDSTGVIVFSEWRPEIIIALFQYLNDRNKGDREGRDKEQCLLVLDDVGLLAKKGKLSEQLDNIAFISRNYGISVIEIAQRITLLTTSMRSQLDALFLFREQNPQERSNLFRSFGFCDKKTFFDILDTYTEEKYAFIGIRNLAGKLCFFTLDGEIRPTSTDRRAFRGQPRTNLARYHHHQSLRNSSGYSDDLERLFPTHTNHSLPHTLSPGVTGGAHSSARS
jgi:A32 protein